MFFFLSTEGIVVEMIMKLCGSTIKIVLNLLRCVDDEELAVFYGQ